MTGQATTRAIFAMLGAVMLAAATPVPARAGEAVLRVAVPARAGQAVLRVAVPARAGGAGPPGAARTPCVELERRLQGQPPDALRALGRQLGVTLALDADSTPGPLRTVRERVVTPGGPLDVLTVSDVEGRALRHLVLSEAGRGRCRLVGAIDLPAPTAAETGVALTAAPPTAPPTHAVVRLARGAAALVVQVPVRRGTGLLLVRERWHLLDPRGVRTVLDLPVRGLMEGWPSTFDRAFETRVVLAGGAGGVIEVSAAISASFTTGSYIYWMPVEPLFTIQRRADFAWRPSAGRFVLDAARSDIYEDEIEGLFEDAEEQFLRHHVSELIRLAASGTPGQRRWLRHFLDTVADGPERRAVMEALP